MVYNKQNAFGAKLVTDGYGIFYEHGKYKTNTSTNLWWLELGERKDPKESKIVSGDGAGFQIGNPFIYGKINNFYYAKLGFGQQRLIGGKGNKNGVAVSGYLWRWFKPWSAKTLLPANKRSAKRKAKERSNMTTMTACFFLPILLMALPVLAKVLMRLKVTTGYICKNRYSFRLWPL